MKNNTSIFLLLCFSFVSKATEGLDWAVWPSVWATNPIRFDVDMNHAPTGLTNNIATKQHIKNLLKQFLHLIFITHGDFGGF